jgi:protein-S-isoprenylcysteine O-methyltransferase Ste14
MTMTSGQRFAVVTLAFAAAYAVGCRLFIGAMRDADPERQALGRGRVYDPLLVEYGHWIAGACVAAALVDGALAVRPRFEPWVRDAAAGAFVAWCALILWVDAKLGRLFREARERTLMTDGPYALVRHPRYLCWMGLLTSIAVVADSPLGLAAAAGFFVLVRRRIAREERYMQARHGARWAAYAAATKRLVPWLY